MIFSPSFATKYIPPRMHIYYMSYFVVVFKYSSYAFFAHILLLRNGEELLNPITNYIIDVIRKHVNRIYILYCNDCINAIRITANPRVHLDFVSLHLGQLLSSNELQHIKRNPRVKLWVSSIYCNSQ